jgi:hypothetical protein
MPDKAAVTDAIRGWIVPVLVGRYMALREENTAQQTNVIPNPFVGSSGD